MISSRQKCKMPKIKKSKFYKSILIIHVPSVHSSATLRPPKTAGFAAA